MFTESLLLPNSNVIADLLVVGLILACVGFCIGWVTYRTTGKPLHRDASWIFGWAIGANLVVRAVANVI